MERTCQILAPLAAAFPEAKIPEATALVYASRLAIYEPEVLEEAVAQAIDTALRFPPIARLKEIARRISEGKRGVAPPMLTAPRLNEEEKKAVKRLIREAVERMSMPTPKGEGIGYRRRNYWKGNPALDSIVEDGVNERRWVGIVEKQRRMGIG